MHEPRRRIALQQGSFMLWNGENLDFMRFSGIEKVHRNSIKITVDLWRRTRDLKPTPLAGEPLHHLGNPPMVNKTNKIIKIGGEEGIRTLGPFRDH